MSALDGPSVFTHPSLLWTSLRSSLIHLCFGQPLGLHSSISDLDSPWVFTHPSLLWTSLRSSLIHLFFGRPFGLHSSISDLDGPSVFTHPSLLWTALGSSLIHLCFGQCSSCRGVFRHAQQMTTPSECSHRSCHSRLCVS